MVMQGVSESGMKQCTIVVSYPHEHKYMMVRQPYQSLDVIWCLSIKTFNRKDFSGFVLLKVGHVFVCSLFAIPKKEQRKKTIHKLSQFGSIIKGNLKLVEWESSVI